MLANMIKTFEFWVFVVLLITSIVFTAVDLVCWEIAVATIMTAGVTLGLIGKKRAAAK